jgi:hypothetical protein
VRLRGLTDTREGRLTVIVVVGGSLLVATSVANVWMANVADDRADRVRSLLRRELATVSDETLAGFPGSADAIEAVAVRSLADEPVDVVGASRPDRDEVVVRVESGVGWQIRCIEAELRGGATVLTDYESGPC